jgi:hypothetical protein
MATVKRDPNNEAIINVGSNFRIEAGPARLTAVATEELLSNSQTAEHYHAPIDEGNGKVTFAKDAMGNPIRLGEEFTYIDYGGQDREGKQSFYIYKKTPVDPDSEFLGDGSRNPDYVAPEHREKETDDRTFYDYRWLPVATRASEEAAIDFAQREAVD